MEYPYWHVESAIASNRSCSGTQKLVGPGPASIFQHRLCLGIEHGAAASVAGQSTHFNILQVEKRTRGSVVQRRPRAHQLCAGHLRGPANPDPCSGTSGPLDDETQYGAPVRWAQRLGSNARRECRRPLRREAVPRRPTRLACSISLQSRLRKSHGVPPIGSFQAAFRPSARGIALPGPKTSRRLRSSRGLRTLEFGRSWGSWRSFLASVGQPARERRRSWRLSRT